MHLELSSPGLLGQVHTCTHALTKEHTARGWSEVLLLLPPETSPSTCTTDVVTEPRPPWEPWPSVSPRVFSTVRRAVLHGCGLQGVRQSWVTRRGLGEKPCKLPLRALGNETRLIKSRGVSPPELRRKGRGENHCDARRAPGGELRRCANVEA